MLILHVLCIVSKVADNSFVKKQFSSRVEMRKNKVFFTIPNGTQVYTTGRKVKKDGYVWYEIMLAGAYDTGWIAGSLIGF